MRRLLILGGLIALQGCGFTGGLSTIGSQSSGISGTAASLFGIPAATVASQVTAEITEIQAVALQLQMLRAQLNGAPIVVPPLPAATIVPTPTSLPGGL